MVKNNRMNSFKIDKILTFGKMMLSIGFLAIIIQMFSNLDSAVESSVNDSYPSDFPWDLWKIVYFSLILGIGLVSIFIFLRGVNLAVHKASKTGRKLAYWMYLFATLAINASFLFGGGWFIGLIMGDLGISLLLFTILGIQKEKRKQIKNQPSRYEKISEIISNSERKKTKRGGMIVSISLIVTVVLSASIPYGMGISNIPNSFFSEASAIPQGTEPNHTNTFYIMPIWEGSANGEETLAYMKRVLGGNSYTGDGFVRIGRSVSCWYTNSLHANGSFNPASLEEKLDLANRTNTPILFHMNGGNWGQCCNNENENITSMRANINNCQWDQRNVCHPINFNPGPNDRFWSLAPGTEWEQFREYNIKIALEIIYEWWQTNPNLLVGFSTDSEIHLNYHGFEDQNEGGYRSYFDYNPKTIEQYKQWAQSNWTLTEFNNLCGTNFGSWTDLDVPRDPSVVGKEGNPWWEMWTDFRIWHVWAAGKRQCNWINQMGFPRDMIWNHQILSEPGSESARYVRCDPIETAINPYCKVGVTRYGWISADVWHSLGELGLEKTNDDKPSWGIFEWNIWHDHRYKLYEESLKQIYKYGGHVICPNEWINCSRNEGLWIPGEECEKEEQYTEDGVTYGSDECGCGGSANETESCCIDRDEDGNCTHWVYKHGNPQFQKAIRDFVAIAQDYERGTAPGLDIDRSFIYSQSNFEQTFQFFANDEGIYLMGGIYVLCIIYVLTIAIKTSLMRKKKEDTPGNLQS